MDNDEKISNFMSVTGVSRDRATFYLEANAWNVEIATGSYFQDQDEPEILEPEPSGDSSAAITTDEPSNRRHTRSTRNTGPGVHTLSSMAALSSDSGSDGADEDERGQAFYAGGSQQSGQQILGPPRSSGRRGGDIVKEMFRAAREHGAEEVAATSSESSGRSSGRQRVTFVGTGYRLGQTDSDHVPVTPASSVSGAAGGVAAAEPRTVKLRLWRTGFSVDDGELREFTDASNQQFLQDIRAGHVPRELLQSSGGGEVHLDMEDHRHEDYVQPKRQLKSFCGAGHRLGSPTPTVLGAASSDATTAAFADVSGGITVDSSQPIARVQVRLDDGQRLSVSLNHGHTVADLRSYISTTHPEYSRVNFALRTTFPNRELTDNSQTVKEAQLINAVVMVRRLN